MISIERETFDNNLLLTDFMTEYGQFGHAFCGFNAVIVRKDGFSEPFLRSLSLSPASASISSASTNRLFYTTCFLLSRKNVCTFSNPLDTISVNDYIVDVEATGSAELILTADLNAPPIVELPSYKFQAIVTGIEDFSGGISINYGIQTVSHY